MINDPIQTRRATLTWQRPLEQDGRRDRVAVAELIQREERVEFSYLDEEHLGPAREAGLTAIPVWL